MKKFSQIIIAVFTLGTLLVPNFATAAPKKNVVELTNPLQTDQKAKLSAREIITKELLGKGMKTVLGIVGSLALLMFIYGGFIWLTSAGTPERVKKGRDTLMWATIGLLIVFTSATLVNLVIQALSSG